MVKMDALRLFRLYWRLKLPLFVTAIIVALISIITAFVMQEKYRAETTILPSGSSTSSLEQFAAMAGLNLPKSNSPTQMYPEILKSRRMLSTVMNDTFTVDGYEKGLTLIDYWYGTEKREKTYTDIEIDELTISKLRRDVVSVTTGQNSDLITVYVLTDNPGLSAQIANKLIEELDRYNRAFRKIKAKEQRIFIEERLAAFKSDLSGAEERLRAFREKNRRVIDSPSLMLEQERIVRNIELLNLLYMELNKQYELVKIEEVKDTPVVDILDSAVVPAFRYKPNRRMVAILICGMLMLVVLGSLAAYEWYGPAVITGIKDMAKGA